MGSGSKDRTAIQSVKGSGQESRRLAVGAQDGGGEGARPGPSASFSSQPTQLAQLAASAPASHAIQESAARAARRPGAARAPALAGGPRPLPTPPPPPRKQEGVRSIGGGAGRKLRKSPRVRSLSGAAAGPLASCPAQAGQRMGAAGGQGLITWRRALPTSPQATTVTTGLLRVAPRTATGLH